MYYASISTLSERIRRQEVSPVDVAEACLRRIETLNPRLNAFITVDDRARERARAAAEDIADGNWRGPLHGIPVAVKDFYDTAGLQTTGGVEQMKDRVPETDAQVVTKLEQAGAILIGKTNMDALGMATTGLTSYFGPVRNPWNEDFVPGGSSAGSAVAVASGMCFATVDTDAIGSVRLPAACCGVVGFKGDYDLISLRGVLGDGPVDDFIRWMAHAGITTRSVPDTALVLNAVADTHGPDFTAGMAEADTSIRVGIGTNFRAAPEAREAFDKAVALLRDDCGYPVHPVATAFGDNSPGSSMENIETDRATIADRAFSDVEVLVLTTLESTVPTIEGTDPEMGVSPENTGFANYYSLPAISIPCGFDSHGMPVGLQIVGKPGDDRAVLNVAHQFELRSRTGLLPPVA